MDLLLLFKGAGGVVEEGINLHQYLCTFGEREGDFID